MVTLKVEQQMVIQRQLQIPAKLIAQRLIANVADKKKIDKSLSYQVIKKAISTTDSLLPLSGIIKIE
jgi:hypothetical protein